MVDSDSMFSMFSVIFELLCLLSSVDEVKCTHGDRGASGADVLSCISHVSFIADQCSQRAGDIIFSLESSHVLRINFITTPSPMARLGLKYY